LGVWGEQEWDSRLVAGGQGGPLQLGKMHEFQPGSEIVAVMVFSPFHFKESPINRLTNDALDSVGKIPEHKVCAVHVDRIV